jgi:large subunit ribosomal protein L10
MSKSKEQKEQDLQELTEKLKNAKGVVFADYRGTSVKDLTKFRKDLTAENVFAKVYKLTLVEKALKALGLEAKLGFKTPVIMAISQEDEVTPARLVKTAGKDVKTLSILQGIIEGKMFSKAEVETLGGLPSKDQLRSQFMSVLNGPISAFARVLDARAKKLAEVPPAA